MAEVIMCYRTIAHRAERGYIITAGVWAAALTLIAPLALADKPPVQRFSLNDLHASYSIRPHSGGVDSCFRRAEGAISGYRPHILVRKATPQWADISGIINATGLDEQGRQIASLARLVCYASPGQVLKLIMTSGPSTPFNDAIIEQIEARW